MGEIVILALAYLIYKLYPGVIKLMYSQYLHSSMITQHFTHLNLTLGQKATWQVPPVSLFLICFHHNLLQFFPFIFLITCHLSPWIFHLTMISCILLPFIASIPINVVKLFGQHFIFKSALWLDLSFYIHCQNVDWFFMTSNSDSVLLICLCLSWHLMWCQRLHRTFKNGRGGL